MNLHPFYTSDSTPASFGLYMYWDELMGQYRYIKDLHEKMKENEADKLSQQDLDKGLLSLSETIRDLKNRN